VNIISIEPTPSPNVMKCNLDQPLPNGKRYQYNKETREYAPDYLRKLLEIEGVVGVFQVLDFLSIERHSKADWNQVLSQVRILFGEQELDQATEQTGENSSFGEVQVLVQTLRGIPYQLKLTQDNIEKRFALPEPFQKALLQIQGVTTNVILERTWMDQGVRYGKPEEIKEQLIAEYSAMYNEKRLKRLVTHALTAKSGNLQTEQKKTADEVKEAFQLPNWEDRYAALAEWEPSKEEISILEDALQDAAIAIRRQAVVFLGYIGGKEVLPYLYQAMNDTSAVVRRTAGDTLSDIGDPDALSTMCHALTDKNKLVRWRAARFLFEVGDKTAIPALQQAINDPEFEVKMQAQIALERIDRGEEASGTVWQQMTQAYKSNKDK
jgi:hypothetical protein